MKNTFKIIGYHETCGDKFFTIAITNKEGETHTDTWSEATVMEAAKRLERKNASFDIADDEELLNELSQLAYIEISEEEGNEFDVYIHKFNVDNEVLEFDIAGEFLKTYKSEKAALNFAAKQRTRVL